MKTNLFKCILLLFLFTTFNSCEEPLAEQTFDQLGPENFFQSANDAEALLNGAYSSYIFGNYAIELLAFNEATTDILVQEGGGLNGRIGPIQRFEIDPANRYFFGNWRRMFRGINRANVVLDEVPEIDMDENRKREILGEARFLRAFNYYNMYELWGPSPLILTSKGNSPENRPAKATKEEMMAFFEAEFTQAAADLPDEATQRGRASKAAALGYLARFYLNEKMWAQAADASQQVINLGVHSLFTEGNRTDLFAIDNADHPEFIFVVPFPRPSTPQLINTIHNVSAPPGYVFEFPPKINFAANYAIRSDFLELYEPNDERLDAFVFEYLNTDGGITVLGEDDVRCFKFPEGPNAITFGNTNDHPLLRYADILLMRAEALNQTQGLNGESISLLNEVRGAAGLAPLDVADFASAADFHAFILDERGREFVNEGLRRPDLIRHDVFISKAVDRGLPAQSPKHLLFPFPQEEIDVNENLEQNTGY